MIIPHFFTAIFDFITLAGLPTQIVLDGKSFVTTLPAPTITLSEIFTPGIIIEGG